MDTLRSAPHRTGPRNGRSNGVPGDLLMFRRLAEEIQQFGETGVVIIANRRRAVRLDPFRMLRAKGVMHLPLKILIITDLIAWRHCYGPVSVRKMGSVMRT